MNTEEISTAEIRGVEVPVTRRFTLETNTGNRETNGANGETIGTLREEVGRIYETMPSMSRRAVNFGGALVQNTVSWLKGEGWNREPELAKKLHAVCNGGGVREKRCEYYRDSDFCGHPKCGCYLGNEALVSKTRWKSTRCPEGKWDALLGIEN